MEIRDLMEAIAAFEIVDLSHSYFDGMPKWPDHASFAQKNTAQYERASYHNVLTVHEHNGTHIDAPAHFVREGPWHKFIDELPLDAFFGRAVTIDLRAVPPRYSVTRADIENWEAAHLAIGPGDIVLLNFGMTDAWDRGDGEAIARSFPGLTGEAAAYLRDRGAKAVGTDALSIDTAGSSGNPAHNALLGHGVLVLENVANLDQMPDEGFFLCLPLKIRGGSGSPVRAVGLKSRAAK